MYGALRYLVQVSSLLHPFPLDKSDDNNTNTRPFYFFKKGRVWYMTDILYRMSDNSDATIIDLQLNTEWRATTLMRSLQLQEQQAMALVKPMKHLWLQGDLGTACTSAKEMWHHLLGHPGGDHEDPLLHLHAPSAPGGSEQRIETM